MKFTRIT